MPLFILIIFFALLAAVKDTVKRYKPRYRSIDERNNLSLTDKHR